jgi:hypothetical protein
VNTQDAGRAPAARSGIAWTHLDTGIVAAIAIATFALRPLHLVVSRPYWFDESWPAALSKAPWSRLIGLSGSAPVGFVALVKLLSGSGDQRARLLVVFFAAATAAITYVLTRSLEWTSRGRARIAAVVATSVVMLAPVTLRRVDLKQYTCDAACALLLLAIGVAVDRTRTRKLLAMFAVVAVAVGPFSSTSAFVAVAVFAGLLVAALLDRAWRWAIEITVAATAAGVVLAVYFAAVVLPHLHSGLQDYWYWYYLRGSLAHMAHGSWKRLENLDAFLAMPPAVFFALFVAGIVALARLGARVLAVSVPVLWIEMALLGRLKKYPFLDERTSHFLFVSSFVVVAIGAIATVYAIGTMLEQVNRVAGQVSVVVMAAVLASLFGIGVAPYLYGFNIPYEGLRTQTRYVAAHRGPHDVVLVDYAASYGLAYYWPHAHLAFRPNQSGLAFEVDVVGIRAVYVRHRTAEDKLAGLRDAMRLWHAAPRGSRLFIVRTHLSSGDVRDWSAAFETLHVKPTPIPVGAQHVLVVAG